MGDVVGDHHLGPQLQALGQQFGDPDVGLVRDCLLYTSDAADERSSVDLGGRRIIKKKKTTAVV